MNQNQVQDHDRTARPTAQGSTSSQPPCSGRLKKSSKLVTVTGKDEIMWAMLSADDYIAWYQADLLAFVAGLTTNQRTAVEILCETLERSIPAFAHRAVIEHVKKGCRELRRLVATGKGKAKRKAARIALHQIAALIPNALDQASTPRAGKGVV